MSTVFFKVGIPGGNLLIQYNLAIIQNIVKPNDS